MSDETILTAARRLVRFVRINDAHDGGLLTRDTIQAADTLDREVKKAEKVEAAKAAIIAEAAAFPSG